MLTFPMIVTSYRSPTNTRGARIAAQHKRDSQFTYRASVPYPHELSGTEAHYEAALHLAKVLPFHSGHGVVEAVGHDMDHVYFIVKPPAV